MRHRFHALCPYFAMFPETFAERWIAQTTRPGDLVLDPFCGRGTAPFQALLMGRRAVGNDINPVAYVVTRAKTNAPAASQLRRRITMLESEFEPEAWEPDRRKLPGFFRVAYQASTLRQVLFLRDRLHWKASDVDCMLAAITLGALHGESSRSSSYLSNQMPRTISTKPGYSIRWWEKNEHRAPKRNAFELIRQRISYRYTSTPPLDSALVIQGDVRDLHRVDMPAPVRLVITSPPYLDTTNFEEDQWLRLWFLGGPPRPTRGLISRDDRYSGRAEYWRLISDAWRVLGKVVDEKSTVVIRLGGIGLKPKEIIAGLEAAASFSKRDVKLVQHEVSPMQHRQTRSFRPGGVGLASEVDCQFNVK